MLLTIVVVTFDDDAGFARTIASLKEFRRDGGADVQLLVIDGAERESTRSIVGGLSGSDILLQEPDGGIYDAMNKGLDRSEGSFVWFLNGGDECRCTWTDLHPVLRQHAGQVILTDFVLVSAGAQIARRSRPARDIWHALPTSHQAIFYPHQEASHIRYRPEYRVVADYAYTADLKMVGISFHRQRLTTAAFHLDGMSTERAVEIEAEANEVQATILCTPRVLRVLSRMRHAAARRYRAALAKR